MKRFIIIIYLLCTLLVSQDRSVIFNTGSPDDFDSGHIIDINNSVANRITINNDYVLEAMAFYMTAENSNSNNIKVSIREDDNGLPGQLVSDLSEWNHQIDLMHAMNYNLIVTTNLCIYLEKDNYYWWVIEAADSDTQATWIHSSGAFYNIATSEDSGLTWNNEMNYAGAGGIWAEQVFENATIEGDINFDFAVNVIDIVYLVNYILEESGFNDEELNASDLNHDNLINVVDVVSLVNTVLLPLQANPDFVLEDINPVSEYYGYNIGPSFFSGQVSCYYFGKQG
tara:strand:+ start:177 stop:1028 length:852 start_codon:yes stop_codon:yes gene_type:complete